MSDGMTAIYQFGSFRLDMERYLLLRDQETIPLSPKVFETLIFLVQHRGQVSKKDEIINAIWPDTFVEESNLAQNIFLLRKALGEEKNEHRYILTIPGVGYRFVAPVEEVPATVKNARERTETVSATLSPTGSIAVLPFKPIGGSDADAFLGPGLADALIMRLSSIREIRVRPTTAVLKYSEQEQAPLLIGRELKVDSLLYGIYQREGDHIRVSVQLVSVQDGLTLWAAKFDEQFTDIFTIEDSISAQVVRSLALQLSGEEEKQLTKSHTASPEAFQLYIRGRYYWNQRTSSGLKRALDYAQRAIDIDPAYAQAYIGLADAYSLLGAQHGVLPPRESFPKARAAAVRALEIDPTLAEAYASLGFINCCFDWDWATSEQNFRRAIDLKPNYATAHHWYGEELTTLGRFAEAVTQLQLAQELDPLSLAINTDLAASYYYAREYDKSERYLVNLLELNPNFVRALVVLGRVYERLGRHSEAIEMLTRAADLSSDELATTMALAHVLTTAGNPKAANQKLEELLAISEHRYVSPSNIASIYAIQNNHELTYAWLDRAIQSRDIELIWLKVNPIFDTMRDEARFKEIASSVSPLLLL